MSQYEIYTFILCLIVFVALTALFTTLLTYVVRLSVRLIRHGAEDEKLLKEYEKRQHAKPNNRFWDWIGRIFTAVVCGVLCICFIFSLCLSLTENDFSDDIPSLKVVKSGSMAYKYEGNEYLFQNALNDQIQTFDMIVTQKLPDEFDLQLYDIVVYEYRGDLIIHRIVAIEEPNENHPNQRYFTLQGDAVQYKDKFPVLYSQMRAIYRGERVPFVGSFVAFLQSPAGWLCILLVLFAIIATPIVEKKLAFEKEQRLRTILHHRIPRAKSAGAIIPLSHLIVNLNTSKNKRLRFHFATSKQVEFKFNHKGRERK